MESDLETVVADTSEVRFDDIDGLRQLAGGDFGGFGAPTEITQEMVNRFADLTDDHQWIHIDPLRCERESPFGVPIVHGFFTLALVPRLRRTMPGPTVTGYRVAINFGAESLRFTAPVPVGSSVAARARIVGVVERSGGSLVTSEVAIHVVGREKPSALYRMQVLYRS